MRFYSNRSLRLYLFLFLFSHDGLLHSQCNRGEVQVPGTVTTTGNADAVVTSNGVNNPADALGNNSGTFATLGNGDVLILDLTDLVLDNGVLALSLSEIGFIFNPTVTVSSSIDGTAFISSQDFVPSATTAQLFSYNIPTQGVRYLRFQVNAIFSNARLHLVDYAFSEPGLVCELCSSQGVTSSDIHADLQAAHDAGDITMSIYYSVDCDLGGIDNEVECFGEDGIPDTGDDPSLPFDVLDSSDDCSSQVDLCMLLTSDPTNPQSSLDCDNDGDTNNIECSAGSNPYCNQSTVANPSGRSCRMITLSR